MNRRAPLVIALVLGVACAPARTAPSGTVPVPPLVSEEFRIPSGDPGIDLYLRNKHLPVRDGRDPARSLLFVHGGGYAGEALFDLPLAGMSWMDYIGAHRWDAWLVDVRGHGASSRPPEMQRPAAQGPPAVRTDVAIRDVNAAIQFIAKRRGTNRVALIGWSWGATIVGAFTAAHPRMVSRLVLGAPQWLRERSAGDSNPIGAWLTVEPRASIERWQRAVPVDKRPALMPPSWWAQFEAAAFAGDPEGAKQKPPVVRYPSGFVQDGREYWAAGKPYYDPSRIDVPVLVVHADWDANLPSSMARAVFDALTNAPIRRLVEIGEGTHAIFLERNRLQLFGEVQLFLDEPAQDDGDRSARQ